jgi:hypothetical protein
VLTPTALRLAKVIGRIEKIEYPVHPREFDGCTRLGLANAKDTFEKFEYPVHTRELAGCTRLGLANAKDTCVGNYGYRSVFHSV